MQQHSLFRRYAASWKVMGLNPEEAIEFFQFT
jgi:hypothetical protein